MKLKSLLTLPLFLALLVGCNNKEPKVEVNHQQAEQTEQVEQTESATQTKQTEQTTFNDSDDVTDNTAKDTTFNFTHFSLDVDYDNDISYDVEYENESDGISAEIEDEVNNVHLEGNEAFKKLSKQLEMLTFTAQSADDEVLKQVKDAFQLDESYRKIEVEVRYNDGTKKEYKFRN